MEQKIRFSRRRITVSLFFALLCVIFLSFADFDVACQEIRTNVLRLHIIANSDSQADQQLKYEIRDAILENSGDLFEDVTDIDSAVIQAEEQIEKFTQIANDVIGEKGYSYFAQAYVGDSYFETREYENFTLPAGNYKSVIIKIGKAEGKNWWCVIFPEICLPAASGDLLETVSKESAVIAKSPERYVMRFKVVEIYENIKKLIKL